MSANGRQLGSLAGQHSLRSERGLSLERESRKAAGRCKVQRQKASQFTRAEAGRCGQGQNAGQVPGDPSRNQYWKVVHEEMTIWQRAVVEELIKSWLGGTGESNDVESDRQVKWVGRGENQKWI